MDWPRPLDVLDDVGPLLGIRVTDHGRKGGAKLGPLEEKREGKALLFVAEGALEEREAGGRSEGRRSYLLLQDLDRRVERTIHYLTQKAIRRLDDLHMAPRAGPFKCLALFMRCISEYRWHVRNTLLPCYMMVVALTSWRHCSVRRSIPRPWSGDICT